MTIGPDPIRRILLISVRRGTRNLALQKVRRWLTLRRSKIGGPDEHASSARCAVGFSVSTHFANCIANHFAKTVGEVPHCDRIFLFSNRRQFCIPLQHTVLRWKAILPATSDLRQLLATEQWSCVSGSIAEFFLDAEQLVVLRHPIGTGCRTGLDLSGRQGNCQIGDRGVLGFTASVA